MSDEPRTVRMRYAALILVPRHQSQAVPLLAEVLPHRQHVMKCAGTRPGWGPQGPLI